MSSFLKLVNLIYIPLAILAHLLLKTYLVDAFSLPMATILGLDLLMIFAFTLRLTKRKVKDISGLRKWIQLSLLCFSFLSFYIPTLLILSLVDFFIPVNPVFCLLALFASIAMTFYQAWIVQQAILQHIQVPLLAEDQGLKGLSFAHISDLHLGPFLSADFLSKVIQQIKDVPCEFVCLTGDLIDGPFDAYADCIEPLRSLTKTHPVFFVTGNHEFYYDAELWIQKLQDLGVRVLRADLESISWRNTQVFIAGIDDSLFNNPQEESLKKRLHELSKNCLLLSHRPDTWDHYQTSPVFLQLSGHSHGGQAFPWSLFIRKVMKYPLGLFQNNGKYLFVHRGTGFWGPPNRWLNPPAICVIELI